MFAATFSVFWTTPAPDREAPAPPRKRPAPVFIGDAVQPWQGETMLLAVLRAAQEDDTERNG